MATFHENLKTSFANFKAKYIKSSAAASGGTDLSMVTTGEKYTWNNKSNLALGTTATTAAKGNHTHTASIATDSGTNQLTMAASTKYKLTAGGSTYIFTTPPNTTYSNVSTSAAGLAPKVTDTSKFLKGDGTWATPTNTTTGTTYAAGSVPANTTFGTNGSIKNAFDYNFLSKEFKPSVNQINKYSDLLNVQLGDNNHDTNTPFYFSTDAGTLVNLPPGAPTTFYGWRDVHCEMSLTTVVLHEMYPQYGRIWANTYDTNAGTWYGWRCP